MLSCKAEHVKVLKTEENREICNLLLIELLLKKSTDRCAASLQGDGCPMWLLQWYQMTLSELTHLHIGKSNRTSQVNCALTASLHWLQVKLPFETLELKGRHYQMIEITLWQKCYFQASEHRVLSKEGFRNCSDHVQFLITDLCLSASNFKNNQTKNDLLAREST